MSSFLLVAINAKYIHSNLAVYSLRACAKEAGTRVDLLEFTINQERSLIVRKIWEARPDVLFVSCYIWNVRYCMDVIADVRQVLPDTDIWVGGPEVSYDAKEVLRANGAIRGVMRGEGERIFVNLCRAYADRDRFSGIRGITFRKEDGSITGHPAEAPLNLSDLPFPYDDSLSGFEHRILYYESSRGCPFACSYCLSSIDRHLRFRSLEKVFGELQFFLDHKVPQVKFVDRTFNCDKAHALAIWNYILAHDNGVTNFHFEIAADLIDEEELALFSRMRKGLIQLESGVQSTNPDTIRAIHRTMDFKKVRAVTRRIASFHNIHQHLDLIGGLPFEDYARFRVSFNDVYALHPDQLQLGFLKVLKGSYMHDHIEAYGGRYTKREPYEILSNAWLPYGDVQKLKIVEEMTEIYYNSRQFTHVLAAVEEMEADMFGFFYTLGHYHEENGCRDVSLGRPARYEVLLSHLRETYERGADLISWSELCTLDYYARENAKSRPAFAADLKAYKERIRAFYIEETRTHAFLPAYASYDARQLARMTHVEVVHEGGEEIFLLFDYKDKDPISEAARIVRIDFGNPVTEGIGGE